MRADAAPDQFDTSSLATLADRCVQCGLCLPHCPTYRLDGVESESPRGRIAYVKAVATGLIAATDTGDRHLDHCLGCRRCEEVCPANVEMERLLIGARAAQAQRRPLALLTRARLALLASPGLLQALLGLYRLTFDILPAKWRPLPIPGRGSRRSYRLDARDATVAIFVGCVAAPYESPTRAALIQLLAATGASVAIPSGQGCCGTAAAHAGDAEGAERLSAANRQAFAGQATVLSLASGCQHGLAESLAGVAPVEDALAFLEVHSEHLRFRSAGGRRVALHLPCTQRVLKTDGALRRLLARVPDLELIELPDTGCCGDAGLHMLAEPERAARLRAPLLAALQTSGAVELLSSNIGCRLHLGNGSKIPVRHPIEFLAEHLA